jgi:hypothetical protein
MHAVHTGHHNQPDQGARVTATGNKIKLTSTLPQGEANGLRAAVDQFLDDPAGARIGIVVFDTKGTAENFDEQTVTATVRLRRVEIIGDTDDAQAAKRLMMRAHEQRTGQTVLPLGMETDIDEVFATFATKAKPGAASEEDND